MIIGSTLQGVCSLPPLAGSDLIMEDRLMIGRMGTEDPGGSVWEEFMMWGQGETMALQRKGGGGDIFEGRHSRPW